MLYIYIYNPPPPLFKQPWDPSIGEIWYIQYRLMSTPKLATCITPARTVPCRRRFWSNPIDIWAPVDSPQVGAKSSKKLDWDLGFHHFEMRCHCGVCHWFVEVRNGGGFGFGFGIFRSWKAGFFVKPWTEWKHVFSHKRQGQVLWSNSTSEGSQPSVGELEHAPKTRKATSSFTVDHFQMFWESSSNWNLAIYE